MNLIIEIPLETTFQHHTFHGSRLP